MAPSYIDLYEGRMSLGRFDLPDEVSVKGEPYRLVRAVKRGGNGVVFEARRINRYGGGATSCAVKFLRQQNDVRMDRFANEVRVLGGLAHERIARLYDNGGVELVGGFKVPWMAMELGGENLRNHVRDRGPLERATLIRVATQVCDGLDHVHERGIIHRDLKPENIVWDPFQRDSIKMIDFGIAKRVGEDTSGRPLDQFTREEEFVGPAFFASPELIAYGDDKSHAVDHRSDLFQFGRVLWFLATGRVSGGIPSARERPSLAAVRDLVMELLPDDPAERLENAATLKERLRSLT